MSFSSDARAAGSADQHGFSLLELMIAMICTAIIGGAILSMVLGGNNAFQREPSLTERQQNIRIAMDLIQRDIAHAGSEMEAWVQAFAVGEGNGFAAAPLLDGLGPMGPDGLPSDHLMIIGNPGDCPSIPAINRGGGVVIEPMRPAPACYGLPALTFLQGVPRVPPAPGAPTYVIGFACDPAADNTINFPPGQDRRYNLPGGNAIPDPLQSMSPMQIVRYMIAPDDPADPTSPPGLWRSPRGGIDPSAGPGGTCGIGAGDPGAGNGYMLIARGIEDLQVRYTMAPAAAGGPVGPPQDSPAVVIEPNYNTIVTEVEVTLVARALAPGLQGEMDPDPAAAAAGVPRAVRSRLQSVTTARAALLHLAKVTPNPIWR
jgi:type II secretory pathway pseudopilin PulG